MAVADHIVFVALVRTWFVPARQEDMRKAGFALVDLCALPIPPNYPQFGVELAADWARRGWQGAVAHTRLRCSPACDVATALISRNSNNGFVFTCTERTEGWATAVETVQPHPLRAAGWTRETLLAEALNDHASSAPNEKTE